MKNKNMNSLKYLTISPIDEDWGIVTTTVGQQSIVPKSSYPMLKHPDTYHFKPQSGRVLHEYQLVYIYEGKGYFESASIKRQTVEAGTIILLFPGEWHNYYPDSEIGWSEYWVGFNGKNIEDKILKNFFNTKKALLEIGISETVTSLYKECIRLAEAEHIGYQQIISSIVLHLLGLVYYKNKNYRIQDSYADRIVNEARILMKENIRHQITPENIAQTLGVSYSWFRQTFKRITGISPAQYQTQLLIRKAKEMLTSSDNSISEVAFHLGFEDVGQFSTLFHKKEGITPTSFRKKLQYK